MASGFTTEWNGPAVLTISADDTQLYFAVSNSTEGGRLYGVGTRDGTTTLLTDFTILPDATLHPKGIAVYNPASLVGDLDSDGDIDFVDLGVFQRCFTGTDGGSLAPECESADLANDSDVDLDDFAAFQAALMRGW